MSAITIGKNLIRKNPTITPTAKIAKGKRESKIGLDQAPIEVKRSLALGRVAKDTVPSIFFFLQDIQPREPERNDNH